MMIMSKAQDDWPKTMRAWQYTNASDGLEKALHLNELATPPPASALTPDAVLVRVHYMAVNPADYKLAELGHLTRLLVRLPASPGMDFSGRVVAAGSHQTASYHPGDAVWGRVAPNTPWGTLGEYVLVKNGEGLTKAPPPPPSSSSSSLVEGDEDTWLRDGAAVGTCALTALQTIQPYLSAAHPDHVNEAGPQEPQRVFINGGSGGTGTFGIQIAKALGCHVTTSCSARNADLCRRLGADEVLDYTTQDISAVLSAQGPVFRLVVDNVGFSPPGQEDLYKAANRFLTDDGWFVQVGGGTSRPLVLATLKRALVPAVLGGGKRHWKLAMTAQSHEGLATVAEWMRTGQVQAVVDEVVDFGRAPEAYAKLKTGRTRGKIVVKMHE